MTAAACGEAELALKAGRRFWGHREAWQRIGEVLHCRSFRLFTALQKHNFPPLLENEQILSNLIHNGTSATTFPRDTHPFHLPALPTPPTPSPLDLSWPPPPPLHPLDLQFDPLHLPADTHAPPSRGPRRRLLPAQHLARQNPGRGDVARVHSVPVRPGPHPA